MLFAYCRVSTHEQATDNKTSLQEQEGVCMMYAQSQGLTKYDVQVYVDRGISGTTRLKTRPEGSKMLAAMQPGDTIIAAKLDRIFRSSADALETVDTLKAKGVHLILFDMGTQSVMRDGPSKLFFSMLAAFAEFERGRMVERITIGLHLKKRNGGFTGGRVPYGMKLVDDRRGTNAMLEPDPEQKPHLDLIRDELRRHGSQWSVRDTRRLFARLKIYSRTGKPYKNIQINRMADIVRRQDAQQGSSVAGDQGRMSALQ